MLLLLRGTCRFQPFMAAAGAHYHLAAASNDQNGSRAALARFYITRMLPEHVGLLSHVQCGADGLFDLDHEGFAA